METQDYIMTFTKELLKKLGIAADVAVEKTDEAYQVAIDGTDLGLLIGRHGQTLNAIEHIVGLAATTQANEYVRVTVDAGEWRAQREEQLKEMLTHAIERVKATGKPYELPPMSAKERRVLHMMVADDAGISSESEGEGENRRIVIKVST